MGFGYGVTAHCLRMSPSPLSYGVWLWGHHSAPPRVPHPTPPPSYQVWLWGRHSLPPPRVPTVSPRPPSRSPPRGRPCGVPNSALSPSPGHGGRPHCATPRMRSSRCERGDTAVAVGTPLWPWERRDCGDGTQGGLLSGRAPLWGQPNPRTAASLSHWDGVHPVMLSL